MKRDEFILALIVLLAVILLLVVPIIQKLRRPYEEISRSEYNLLQYYDKHDLKWALQDGVVLNWELEELKQRDKSYIVKRLQEDINN